MKAVRINSQYGRYGEIIKEDVGGLVYVRNLGGLKPIDEKYKYNPIPVEMYYKPDLEFVDLEVIEKPTYILYGIDAFTGEIKYTESAQVEDLDDFMHHLKIKHLGLTEHDPLSGRERRYNIVIKEYRGNKYIAKDFMDGFTFRNIYQIEETGQVHKFYKEVNPEETKEEK